MNRINGICLSTFAVLPNKKKNEKIKQKYVSSLIWFDFIFVHFLCDEICLYVLANECVWAFYVYKHKRPNTNTRARTHARTHTLLPPTMCLSINNIICIYIWCTALCYLFPSTLFESKILFGVGTCVNDLIDGLHWNAYQNRFII